MLARRHRARDGHDLGHGDGDVAQVARVHAHLVVHLVDLDARAIELVLERRLAERRRARRRHRRRNRPASAAPAGTAAATNGARPASPSTSAARATGAEIAGQHRRAADPRPARCRRRARRRRSARPRARPAAARRRAGAGGNPARRAVAAANSSRSSRARAADDPASGKAAEPIERSHRPRATRDAALARADAAHTGEDGAADLHPSLARLAAQERDDDRALRRAARDRADRRGARFSPAVRTVPATACEISTTALRRIDIGSYPIRQACGVRRRRQARPRPADLRSAHTRMKTWERRNCDRQARSIARRRPNTWLNVVVCGAGVSPADAEAAAAPRRRCLRRSAARDRATGDPCGRRFRPARESRTRRGGRPAESSGRTRRRSIRDRRRSTLA